MNVTSMLVGYAFGTIKDTTPPPSKAREEAERKAEREQAMVEIRKSLSKGRATRTANANKRKEAIPGLIISGKTCAEIAKKFSVAVETVRDDVIAAVKAGKVTHEQALASYPKPKPMHERNLKGNRGKQKRTLELRQKIRDAIIETPLDAYKIADLIGLSPITTAQHLRELAADGKVRITKSCPRRYTAITKGNK